MQGAWGCYGAKPCSLQLCNHKVLLLSARKAAEMPGSPKGLLGCNGLFQSTTRRLPCECKMFYFQKPWSLTANVEQKCISLARGGESVRLDCISKSSWLPLTKAALNTTWKFSPPRISIPVFHLIDKVLFNPGPS